MSSHVWFNMHLVLPSLASLELIESHMLPIDGEGRVESSITDGRNLEWEESLGAVHVVVVILIERSYISWVLIAVEDIIITQEFSIESTYDHDIVLRNLAHTSSLSLTNGCLHSRQVQFLPLGIESSCCKLESLNGSWVLLAWVLDTTEDVDPSVVEVACWVVVATFIDFG